MRHHSVLFFNQTIYLESHIYLCEYLCEGSMRVVDSDSFVVRSLASGKQTLVTELGLLEIRAVKSSFHHETNSYIIASERCFVYLDPWLR